MLYQKYLISSQDTFLLINLYKSKWSMGYPDPEAIFEEIVYQTYAARPIFKMYA